LSDCSKVVRELLYLKLMAVPGYRVWSAFQSRWHSNHKHTHRYTHTCRTHKLNCDHN